MVVEDRNEVGRGVECSKASECQCLGPSGTDPPGRAGEKRGGLRARGAGGAEPRRAHSSSTSTKKIRSRQCNAKTHLVLGKGCLHGLRRRTRYIGRVIIKAMPRRHGPVPGQPGNFSRKCCGVAGGVCLTCAAGVARESEPAAPSTLRHVFVRRLARLESLDRRVRCSSAHAGLRFCEQALRCC